MKNKVLKLLVSLALTAACIFTAAGLAGCGDGNDGKPVEVLSSYNNITDFSNKQGWRNWYYLYGDVEEPSYMVFDMDGARWNGRDFYSFIEIRQFHPGNNGESILGFKAPKSGTLKIDGVIKRCPTDFNAQNADGVFVYVTSDKNLENYLWDKIISKDSREEHTFALEPKVKAGEFIYFILNPNGNNSFDNTSFDITISYK